MLTRLKVYEPNLIGWCHVVLGGLKKLSIIEIYRMPGKRTSIKRIEE
jgi:hypothetical protein